MPRHLRLVFPLFLRWCLRTYHVFLQDTNYFMLAARHMPRLILPSLLIRLRGYRLDCIHSSTRLSLIVFCSAGGAIAGLLKTPSEFKKTLTKLFSENIEVSILWVHDTNVTWFQNSHMLLKAFLSLYSKHFKKTYMLGESMGGSASFIYGSLLGSRFLSFNPQVSLSRSYIDDDPQLKDLYIDDRFLADLTKYIGKFRDGIILTSRHNHFDYTNGVTLIDNGFKVIPLNSSSHSLAAQLKSNDTLTALLFAFIFSDTTNFDSEIQSSISHLSLSDLGE
jgi:hypothetical protein